MRSLPPEMRDHYDIMYTHFIVVDEPKGKPENFNALLNFAKNLDMYEFHYYLRISDVKSTEDYKVRRKYEVLIPDLTQEEIAIIKDLNLGYVHGSGRYGLVVGSGLYTLYYD